MKTPLKHLSNTSQIPLKHFSNTSQTPLKHLSRTSKLAAMCLLVFLSNNLYAQFTSQAFFEGYGTRGLQEMFYKSSVIQSSNGYTYMCGASINTSGDYDMLLTKFDSQQQEVWSVTYAGLAGGDDYAADLVEDANGNIIITGTEYISATNYDAITIKYNSQGVQQWVKTYDGTAGLFDGGVAIALDAVDNVYICGGTYGISSLSDFLVIKYTNGGAQQWITTWNGTNSLEDVAARLEIKGASISAVGASQTTQNKWKMASIKMSINSGSIGATVVSGGDASGIDKVADVVIDDADNTYLVGAVKNNGTGYDLRVIKLDPNYSIIWEQDYDGGSNLDDEGLSLKLTSTNDVVVCGFVNETGEGKNFLTRKYSNANGALLWSQTYDNEGGDDEAVSVKITDTDDVIVFGSTYQVGNLDFALQSLKGTNGSFRWETTWNGDSNADDIPSELAIDGDDIYAAGQSYDSDGLYQYVITKWNVKEYAATKPDGRKTPNGFIENRGQLQNNDGSANTEVEYYMPSQWPGTYVTDNKVSYVWSRRDTIGPDTTTYHRIDMAFKKGNTSAKVYPTEKLDHYTNIYLGYLPSKLERTAHYSSITKIEAYTNTDIIYTSHSQGYRHHIVAKQGAPTADFEMEYDGYDSMTLDSSGNLVFGTTFGDHVQSKAKVYNMNPATGELYALAWQPDYVITGDKVSFSFPQTWTGTLVIEIEKEQAMAAGGGGLVDPGNIDWSTFYGNEGNEQINDSDAALGFFYTAGQGDVEQFPLFAGSSNQNVFCNGCGGVKYGTIQCFRNSDCNNRYSIVLGGNLIDDIRNIVARDDGEIFVYGDGSTSFGDAEFYTTSYLNRYVLEDAPQENASGYTFISSFLGPTGVIRWSTYMTSRNLHLNLTAPNYPLVFSNDDELYMCGSGTNTFSDDLSVFGAFNWSPPASEPLVGFVFRFNEEFELVWSTEFGGGCVVKDATFTEAKDIVITGTRSANSIALFDEFETDGQETFSYGGGDDGFLIAFDAVNELDWYTWLGGSGEDNCYAIDSKGNTIYVGGQTSSSNFPFEQPAIIGQYFFQNSPSNDAFIAQFDEDQLVWSTLLGNDGSSSLQDIKALDNEELYLYGITNSPNFPVYPLQDAYNESQINMGLNTGNVDAFLWRFGNKYPEWSTYVGGNEGENAASLTISEDNYLFLSSLSRSDVAFPWWEFNTESLADHFDNQLQTEVTNNDMYITRFDLNLLALQVSEVAHDDSNTLSIFPNPSTSLIQISIPQNEKFQTAEIYDSQGKLVLNIEKSLNNISFLDLNISSLENRAYNIIMTTKSNRYMGRFVKLGS
ncbi:MAG: T9SS type A sorting domain-containing protein [Flavobacteriales bacterium]